MAIDPVCRMTMAMIAATLALRIRRRPRVAPLSPVPSEAASA